MPTLQSITRNGRDATLQKYLGEISEIPVLTRAEEITLIPAAQSGDRTAFEKIVRSNLRYVVTIAREYESKGMSLSELIGEGNFGLFRALKSFDSTRGIKFITYAKWWIRQYIVYALIYKNHLVRVPQSQLRKLSKQRKKIAAREKKLQRLLSEVEVVDIAGEDDDAIYSLSNQLIRRYSLDAPLKPDNDERLIDMLQTDEGYQPDDNVNDESLKKDIAIAMGSTLKDRERDILRLLFGLGSNRPLTLGEVGQKHGISRERVRQIKEEALSKLRDVPEVRQALSDYLM